MDILKVIYDATIAVQIPHFTLSDFFCTWIRIHVRLNRLKSSSELKTNLVDILLKSLDFRKTALLKHPSMLCAIYLDPRVYRSLSENEMKIAKMALADLHQRVINLKDNLTDSSVNKTVDSLEEYYDNKSVTKNDCEERADFMQLLDNFRFALPHENKDKSVFEFWECKKEVYPAIYKVACVVNAIPPSQVTVERAFSALNYIFSNKRCRLNQQTLENCLMIKLNPELAASINECDLNEIESVA